jgi:hypothetical protein
MSKYVASHKKGFIALVALLCLATTIASTWRAYSQTSQVPSQDQGTKPMDMMIENLRKSGVEFPAVELFQAQEPSASALTLSRAAAQNVLGEGIVLNPDKEMAQRIASGEMPSMTLRLPDPSGKSDSVELELTKVDIFADGFTVVTSSSGGRPVDYEESAHYRGVVKGSPGSLATLSVLGDEVVGMYSTPAQGNFVLGRLGGDNLDNSHILYAEANLLAQNSWECLTKEDPTTTTQPVPDGPTTQLAGGCVRIYEEADHDLFLNKGSWVFSGATLRGTGSYPHSGVAYSIVVNADNTTGAEYQQITIPSGATRNLTFWLNVTSSETTTTTQYDRIFVEVRSTSGALLSTLATFSNLNKGTAGAYVQRGPYSLSAYAGQTVRIQFRATNNASSPTSFRVDDVSVK